VEFLVQDQGTGLAESVRQVLFRPLRSSKPGGGGIGLAISHQLARHAGGSLELARSDGTGSVFRLVVPAVSCTPAE
jgi:signal transduction histidine kinase